jgi:hypothetical protein
VCGENIGETPVFKKRKRKANRPPRFMHHHVPLKPPRRFDQLHAYHRPAAPSKDVPPGQEPSQIRKGYKAKNALTAH